jgi:acetylglutamate kinase
MGIPPDVRQELVLNNQKQLISTMDAKMAGRFIREGTISGGMIPKVTSVINAVENGVMFAHIINGNLEHNLLLELFTREGVGTMITLK